MILKKLPIIKSLLFVFGRAIAKGPNKLKNFELVPIVKDENNIDVEKYRSISFARNVSKVLETVMFDELYERVKNKLNQSQQ